MPQLRLPYKGYQIGSPPDAADPIFTIPTGKAFQSPAIEVLGRQNKTFWVLSTTALAFELWIAPERDLSPDKWLLYKTALTVGANDPFIFHSDHTYPFISLRLTNSSGSTASVKAWLFAQ